MGNVRTALFSYCLATDEGRFLVRIEDTDRERYRPESVGSNLETLRWLGLQWDEGPDIGGPCAPYTESERLPYYGAVADELVRSGAAYLCFCTRERLDALREAQRASGQPTRYDGRCRHLPMEELSRLAASELPRVVRLAVSPGRSSWTDLVLGAQEFDNEAIDDQVLLKSDSFPTYHLAQVVDDHLMGITQVIRGVEWVPSTPKHLMVYRAMGWEPPQFAHVPLVLGTDHSKLAKRHGAQTVREYQEMGYLPEAIINFLAFLGWSPGTEEEIFTLEELRRRMSFERLQASPAVLDQQRLDYLNGVWIRKLTVEQLAQRLRPFLPEAPPEWLQPIAAMVQERIKRLDEVPALLLFAFTDPDPSVEELRGKLSAKEAAAFLERALGELERPTAELMGRLKLAAQELGPRDEASGKRYFREVMHTLRLAITGQRISPPLPQSIELIGLGGARARVERAIQQLRAAG